MTKLQSAENQMGHERWIDMATVMRIENLQWRARSIVDGFHNGLHRSPKHGFSVEFSEYRPFAREMILVHRLETVRQERSLLHQKVRGRNESEMLYDCRSKSFDGVSISRAQQARVRSHGSGYSSYYWSLQRDAIGLVTFDQAVADVLPARFRTGQLKRLLSLLARDYVGKTVPIWLIPLLHLAELVSHRSLMVIVSEFFCRSYKPLNPR